VIKIVITGKNSWQDLQGDLLRAIFWTLVEWNFWSQLHRSTMSIVEMKEPSVVNNVLMNRLIHWGTCLPNFLAHVVSQGINRRNSFFFHWVSLLIQPDAWSGGKRRIGDNNKLSAENRCGEILEWNRIATVSIIRAHPQAGEWDTEKTGWFSAVLTMHLLWPNTQLVYPHCLLLQHPVQPPGSSIRPLFICPYLLHLLWMHQLKKRVVGVSEDESPTQVLLVGLNDSA
jgi:hypothetical protein